MGTLIVAGVALFALWVAIVAGRRRAQRRAEEARARDQARRSRVPLVSANLRGQSATARDLWQDAVGVGERDGAAPPVPTPRSDH